MQWFRETKGVYSIKELEKSLPTVASISGMVVKDFIQALTDENLIRVEKIGSGNWYWSFPSEAKNLRENMLNKVKDEEGKLLAGIAEAEQQLEEEAVKRAEDEEMLDGGGMDRSALLDARAALIQDNEALDDDLSLYSDNDPTEILRKMEETAKLKESAVRWTENIESLESLLLRLTSNDRSQVAQMMEQACGGEYVPGEGLKELLS